jgi:hypothetical protein
VVVGDVDRCHGCFPAVSCFVGAVSGRWWTGGRWTVDTVMAWRDFLKLKDVRFKRFQNQNPNLLYVWPEWVVAKVQKMAQHVKNQKYPITRHTSQQSYDNYNDVNVRFSSIGTSKTIHIKLETPFIIRLDNYSCKLMLILSKYTAIITQDHT